MLILMIICLNNKIQSLHTIEANLIIFQSAPSELPFSYVKVIGINPKHQFR